MTGAHLNDSSFPLFHQVFSQEFSILYRWAPMQNKEDALRTETQLLSTFDYAWSTSNNGIRRPDDILQKLHQIASGTRTLSDMARALLPFTQKQVGIQIKSIKLDEADNGSYNLLPRVFSFNRLRSTDTSVLYLVRCPTCVYVSVRHQHDTRSIFWTLHMSTYLYLYRI
ncbi:Protein EFFECTOR OF TRANSCRIPTION 2 [Glycine soja]|uniref:Protein EFFECTOR OF TRANSCRIPTION 2 n=1 Tax=Glycine soja TaxID=3848 RepID=A0A445LWV1_GLYSO|nr:Protein EFFECTOR OF TRANSCRIPTION 2 [Glycine soja]